MKKFRRHLLGGLVALTLGAGSVAAYANQPACEGWGEGHASAADHQKFAERMKQRIAKREAELHGKLKLNAGQEAAWNSYIAKMRPEAPSARPERARFDKLPAPERMEKMLELMKQREGKMTQRLAATKEFYAVLTPEQQQVFNDAFGHRRHRFHRHHHQKAD